MLLKVLNPISATPGFWAMNWPVKLWKLMVLRDFKKVRPSPLYPTLAAGNVLPAVPENQIAARLFKCPGSISMEAWLNTLSVPSNSLVHGAGLGADALALVEPLAIGAHGVRRAEVKEGEFVLVVGAGPIGLGIMEFARIAGGRVIAMDINQSRLDFCRDILKVDYTIQAKSGDITEQLKAITSNDMPTVVIDATGSQRAINNAFQYMAHGGRYVLVGLQKGDITISHPEFHKREATLMSSRNATREDFDRVIDTIKTGEINPLNYITHRVLFDQVKDEFASWLNPASGVIKAMVEVF